MKHNMKKILFSSNVLLMSVLIGVLIISVSNDDFLNDKQQLPFSPILAITCGSTFYEPNFNSCFGFGTFYWSTTDSVCDFTETYRFSLSLNSDHSSPFVITDTQDTQITSINNMAGPKTVYAKLETFFRASEPYVDTASYFIPACESTPRSISEITNPVPNSILTSRTTTFDWTDAGNAQYSLFFGDMAPSNTCDDTDYSIYQWQQLDTTFVTVDYLPIDGRQICVMMCTDFEIDDDYLCDQFNEYTYTTFTSPLLSTPIISTRGHTEECDTPLCGDPVIILGQHTTTDYDTTGDIPGLEVGSCTDEIVTYVHGFNNDVDDAIENFNLSKTSLGISSYEYPLVGFSWDSDPGKLDWYDAEIIAELNGPKLGAFVKQFKDSCPDTKVRLIGHSLGARVILTAIQDLYDTNWNNKISSVHLLGAAVDNDVIGKDHDFGVAIENMVGEFHNKFNIEDDVLQYLYPEDEDKAALGETGAEDWIVLPVNYYQEDVTQEVGDDHSGYNRHSTDPDAIDPEGDGVMDNVVYDWENPSPPVLENWVITEDIVVQNSIIAPADVIVQDGAVLTITSNASLDVDLINHKIMVQDGSGILIIDGGSIK